MTFFLYQKSLQKEIQFTDDTYQKINPTWKTKIIVVANLPMKKEFSKDLCEAFGEIGNYNLIIATYDMGDPQNIKENVKAVPQIAGKINFLIGTYFI